MIPDPSVIHSFTQGWNGRGSSAVNDVGEEKQESCEMKSVVSKHDDDDNDGRVHYSKKTVKSSSDFGDRSDGEDPNENEDLVVSIAVGDCIGLPQHGPIVLCESTAEYDFTLILLTILFSLLIVAFVGELVYFIFLASRSEQEITSFSDSMIALTWVAQW